MRLSCFSVVDHYPSDRYPGHDRSIADRYRELLEDCVLAERLGYEIFFVAEHHFDEYGVIPNPAVWLAAAAARTERIRLAPAIAVLPFRDPRTVAEDYAILDQLCRGRLVFGAGSGYLRHEFEGFNIDGRTKRERFDEGLELVRRLWRGERVRHAGRHYALDDVAINVRPYGGREPETYIAVLREEAAWHIGRAGENLMTVPYATVDRFEDIGRLIGAYRRGAAEVGHAPRSLVALHTHVADSDAAARAEAEQAFDLYVATRKYAKSQTYGDILESGLSLFGSVRTVADKLVALHRMGVDHVMALYTFGDLPAELGRRSLRLLAEEALPAVRARIAEASAG